MSLPAILAAHKRIAIVGGPGVGKSTLAAKVKDRPVLCTDDTMLSEWPDQPGILKARVELVTKGKAEPQFCVEGVQVARAIRKGLEVDAIIVLETPREPRTPDQAAMAKGHEKILAEAMALNPNVRVYREGDL